MKRYISSVFVVFVGLAGLAQADLFSQGDKALGKSKAKTPKLVQVNPLTQEVTGVFDAKGIDVKSFKAVTKLEDGVAKKETFVRKAVDSYAVDTKRNKLEDGAIKSAPLKLADASYNKDAPTSAWYGWYYGPVVYYYTVTYYVTYPVYFGGYYYTLWW